MECYNCMVSPLCCGERFRPHSYTHHVTTSISAFGACDDCEASSILVNACVRILCA